MATRRIYADYNATTPLAPEVLEAMLPYLREHHGNASSVHLEGRQARAAIDDARARLATLLGAQESELIFTALEDIIEDLKDELSYINFTIYQKAL